MSTEATRVSDAEREEVAGARRTAAGEGRLGMEEPEQRLEATYFWPIWPALGWGVAFLPFAGGGCASHRRRHGPRAPV